jgi:hypothetical protein
VPYVKASRPIVNGVSAGVLQRKTSRGATGAHALILSP